MMPQLDPAQLAAAKTIGENVKAEITVNKAEGTFTLKLIPNNEAGKIAIPQLLTQMSAGLAQQMSIFFGVKGSIKKA